MELERVRVRLWQEADGQDWAVVATVLLRNRTSRGGCAWHTHVSYIMSVCVYRIHTYPI